MRESGRGTQQRTCEFRAPPVLSLFASDDTSLVRATEAGPIGFKLPPDTLIKKSKNWEFGQRRHEKTSVFSGKLHKLQTAGV